MAVFDGRGLLPSELLERRPWTELLYPATADDPADVTDNDMPFCFGFGLLAWLALGASRMPRGFSG